MLYSVEMTFRNKEHEPEWNVWYDSYIAAMVSVPGINTAQRFRGERGANPPYLALYSLPSTNVFQTQAYKDIGGGGNAGARWSQYRSRERNLFDGVECLPEVTGEMRVVLTDIFPRSLDIPNLFFARLEAVGLDKTTEARFIAVATEAQCREIPDIETLQVYRPTSRRLCAATR